MKLTIKRHSRTVNLRYLMAGIFITWPFVYCLWTDLKVTSALYSRFPIVLLFSTALLGIVLYGRLYKSMLLYWLVFYGVTLALCWNSNISTYLMDLSVSLASWVICYTLGREKVSYDQVWKYLNRMGIFTAATVLVGKITGIFSRLSSVLYSNTVASAMEAKTHTGIFRYSGVTGCFLVAGLFAFLVGYRLRKKGAYYWGIIALYAISILLIRKRGFIIDIAVSIVVVLILNAIADKNIKIKLNRLLIIITSALVIIGILFTLYYSIPFVRSAVDEIVNRFADDDGSLSGRTQLYQLALRLFKQNPLIGIGWGNFRRQSLHVYNALASNTFETHNVYLQLLCETGIIGLASFLIAVGGTLFITIKRFIAYYGEAPESDTASALRLSIFLQLFFITYCMSGNPLYDFPFVVTYFIGLFLLGVDGEAAK